MIEVDITKTLFQEDSKGKPRCWDVRTNGADIIVSYGLVGGKIAQKVTKAKPKNIGKANETTAEEQAILEAESKWRKQVKNEDYHPDITQAGLQLRPMLARDYTKVGHQVDFKKHWDGKGTFSWIAQPKLDGLRLSYGWRYSGLGKPELLTRKGETYVVDHIADASDRLLDILRSLTNRTIRGLDGELYLHGLPLNEINQRAKKYREGLTEELEYHLFDLIIEDMDFYSRYQLLSEAIKIYNVIHDKIIKKVSCRWAHSEMDMKTMHHLYASQGYEGVMLRDSKSQYMMGQRPDCLYKYKEFMDAEYEIIDQWPDKNGCIMFTMANPDGIGDDKKTFNCTPKRSHDERKKMLETDHRGLWMKVKFQAQTQFNVPEFPVGLEFREVDDNGKPVE